MISNYNDFYRALHDPSVTEIDLAGNAKIELKEPIELDRPVTIRGNGGMIYGNVPHAVRITGSEITIEDLVMNEFGRAVMIDAEDHTAENIILRKLMINDPGYGVGISIGSSESNGQIKNVTISGCTFNSGYSDETADKLGFTDGSNAIYVSARSEEHMSELQSRI